MQFISRYRIAIILAIVRFAVPFLLQHPVYELHRDEYLYLQQGHHLAWGFMEVPPLLAVLANITWWLGGSFFWVKFWPALLASLTTFFACAMAAEMGGRAFAQFIAGACLLFGVYLRINFLFQANSLEIFCWTLGAYFFVRYANTQRKRYVYALGIALGVAFLSKYSAVFFIAGVAIALLLTPYRRLYRNKHLYLAGLVALLMVSPNLWWQYTHNWPVVHHMQQLRQTQLRFLNPLSFLMGQVLMHLPYFFVWMGGLWWLLLNADGKRYRPLAWIFISVIVLLVAGSGKDYYSAGAYPMLFAAGGVWLERTTVSRLWLRGLAVIVIVLLCLPMVPLMLPTWAPAKLTAYYRTVKMEKTGALKWEDQQNHPLPQDFADMLGWREMAGKVESAYDSLPDSIRKTTMIYARNYGQAGAIAYYAPQLPQVYSDNGSFLLWMPDDYHFTDLLFIGGRMPGADDEVFQQFESYQVLDSVTAPYAREKGTKIIWFKQGNSQMNSMVKDGIRQMKNEFKQP